MCSHSFRILSNLQGGKRPRIPGFVSKSMRQLLKSCWHAKSDMRPKLGSVCLALREEISGFKEKKSSRSLMERTQHLRFMSKRSLRTAWEALGLPTSSNHLGGVKLGDPSSDLKPITEHEPTETSELSLLTRLEALPPTKSNEVEWHDRCLFGSVLECQMPSTWNDLSWDLAHVSENRELWQDGEGETRENCSFLLKAELRKKSVNLDDAIGFYYAEAANTSEVAYDHRKWLMVPYDGRSPSCTKLVCGKGVLLLDSAATELVVELAVLRRVDIASSMEIVISLYSMVDPQAPRDDKRLSSTFLEFVESLHVNDVNEV